MSVNALILPPPLTPGERRLLPEGRVAGPMPWIIAVMAFLAALALIAGLALDRVAGSLGEGLSRRLTVQLVTADPAARDAQARDALALLAAAPAVAAARAVPVAELDGLLAPWLGPRASRTLPLPAMIDVELRDSADPAALARALARAAPDARIDRHDAALAPLAGLVATLRALAALLVLLMAGAMAAVIMLAARAALDTHRATIDILHLLGAADAQVARLYARRLALDALTGAAVGAGAAALVLWALGRGVARLETGLAALAAPGWAGAAALILLPAAAALLAMGAARATILHALARAT